MQVNFQNTEMCNFKGAFLINYAKAEPQTRKFFEEAIGNNRIIIENYKNKKDSVLYILRNGKDYLAAQFLKYKNIKLLPFTYMPEITTKSRLDSRYPKEAERYIEENAKIKITGKRKLEEFISANRKEHKIIPNSHLSVCERILKQLKIIMEGEQEKDSKGITHLKGKNGIGRMDLSPSSNRGFRYAYIKPDNLFEEPIRCSIDIEQNIRIFPVDKMQEFWKLYHNTIKELTKRPRKHST